ncbi:MAG TPA: alpha/beta hydrolase [Anaerolineales bacterium]|nr:alpha/beta hydrolase [Anaerolineales bacterium]
MIPSLDFGGSGPRLHFAHANGFPPGAYKPLIETLTQHYHVCSMLFRPLWPELHSTPQTLKSWADFADDLLRFFDERDERGVIGVGHSLGAIVTLVAALRRPELFRALVLIDPVLFRRRMQWAWDFLKRFEWGRNLHPFIPGTMRRRRLFATRDEMFAHFRFARPLRHIDDRGLWAYVDSIAKPRPDGQIELAYSPEWEVKVYEAGPLDLWSQLKELKSPLIIIRGVYTNAFLPKAAQRVQNFLPDAIIHTVEGAGHLVPLEKPDAVGMLISEFLSEGVMRNNRYAIRDT